jgi:hypothetical protein
MFAHHVVDVDIGADRGILLQVPDIDRVGTGRIEHDAERVVADRDDRTADPGIAHDAALEISGAGLVENELAQQVHASGGGVALLAVGQLVQRNVAQRSYDQRASVPDAEERPDGEVGLAARERRGRELHHDLGAADRHHAAKGFGGIRRRRAVTGKLFESGKIVIGHGWEASARAVSPKALNWR